MTTTTENTADTKKADRETHPFQAETRKLLDIVIHSLYTNKEIFLRELISNSSDALDRLRFEALSKPELLGEGEELRIVIEPDPESRTLTVTDNGIGMSRDEVITNIGTIAKSGTRELMERIKESKSSEAVADLIGQFGVGFYSAFMVADRVKLITRRAGEDKATRWESTGDGQYTLDDDYSFRRGTSIVLFLKDVDRDNGIDDFTDFNVIQRIVKRYSDFVTYPIVCKHRQTVTQPDAEPGEAGAGLREETLNSMKPIWTRPPSDVTKDEYAEFYKHISHDWNEPFHPPLSLRAEGRIEYQALLFIPQKSPFDLFRDQRWGLQLYVRRVLIMDRCAEILPPYLRFVRGVVESADLPLNISRETIQQDRLISQMRKWLTRKVIDHLKEWKEQSNDEYLTFWKELGRVLKEGVGQEPEHRERLLPLLYFPSSHDPEKLTSLAEYVERMKEDQDHVYYMTGESRAQIESSPHLEAFKEKGYEVLYMTDPIDEWMTQSLDEYDDHKLKSVRKGKVELGSDEEIKKAREELKEKRQTYKDLMELLQTKLDEWVKEVRLSTRLTTSPVCLVGGDWDMSPQMERMMRQTEGTLGTPRQKRIMELNPDHEILVKLRERFEKDQKDPKIDDYAQLLLGYALLAEGSELPDPARYNKLVGELMLMGL